MKSKCVVAAVVYFVLFVFTTKAIAENFLDSSGAVIVTSKSTLILTQPNLFISESNFVAAGHAAEIIADELIDDIQALIAEEGRLKNEVATFGRIWTTEKANFSVIKSRYNKKLAKYEAMNKLLTAEILEFNSLPYNQQNNEVYVKLMERKDSGNRRHESLNLEKEAGSQYKAEAEARLQVSFVANQEKIVTWNNERLPKMASAYRQLKLVVVYTKQLRKGLIEQYSEPNQTRRKHPGYNSNGMYPVIDRAEVFIKALNDRGFDQQ